MTCKTTDASRRSPYVSSRNCTSRSSLALRVAPLLLAALACLGAARCGPPPILPVEEGWIPGPSGPVWVSYEVDAADNVAVYQDDMTYPLDALRAYQSELPEEEGQFTVQAGLELDDAWPNGVIPYELAEDKGRFASVCQVCIDREWCAPDGSCRSACDHNGNGVQDRYLFETCQYNQEEAILDAIDYWNEKTNVQLVERTTESYWVRFVRHVDRCRSDVGYENSWAPNWWINDDPQRIELASSCGMMAVVHEIGHTVGFRHEQSRPDRDHYVTIFKENIVDGKEGNFDKKGRAWGDYNYFSRMHYFAKTFSKNDLDTIQARIPLPDPLPGQPWGLSKGDIAAANALVAKGKGQEVPSGYRALSKLAAVVDPGVDEVHSGDVDGDGKEDLVVFLRDAAAGSRAFDAQVWLGREDGVFFAPQRWHDSFCDADDACAVGDVDGDGRADVVRMSWTYPDHELVVARSSGASFGTSELWGDFRSFVPLGDLHLADVNGDCRDDAVFLYWYPATNHVDVRVALSGGNGFEPVGAAEKIVATRLVGFAKMGADAREDLVVSDPQGNVWVHAGDGPGFAPADYLIGTTCMSDHACAVGDVNADAFADLVIFDDDDTLNGDPKAPHHLARVHVLPGQGVNGLNAATPTYHELDCKDDQACFLADVTGGGTMDVVEPFGRREPDVAEEFVFVSASYGVLDNGLNLPAAKPAACTASPPTSSPLWKQVSTFPVEQVAATWTDLYALSSEDRSVKRHVGGESGSEWVEEVPYALGIAASQEDLFLKPHPFEVRKRVASGLWETIATFGFGANSRMLAGPSSLFLGLSSQYANVLNGYECPCGDSQGRTTPGWTQVDLFTTQGGWAVGGMLPGPEEAGPLPTVYRRDTAGVWEVDIVNMTWTQIRGPAGEIVAGGLWVFATDPSTGQLYGRQPYGSWSWISHAAEQFVADQDYGHLYKRSASGVEKWSGVGSTWVSLGGDAKAIFATRGRLFKTSAASGQLFEFDPQ
jgi:hypothetical protein